MCIWHQKEKMDRTEDRSYSKNYDWESSRIDKIQILSLQKLNESHSKYKEIHADTSL